MINIEIKISFYSLKQVKKINMELSCLSHFRLYLKFTEWPPNYDFELNFSPDFIVYLQIVSFFLLPRLILLQACVLTVLNCDLTDQSSYQEVISSFKDYASVMVVCNR